MSIYFFFEIHRLHESNVFAPCFIWGTKFDNSRNTFLDIWVRDILKQEPWDYLLYILLRTKENEGALNLKVLEMRI